MSAVNNIKRIFVLSNYTVMANVKGQKYEEQYTFTALSVCIVGFPIILLVLSSGMHRDIAGKIFLFSLIVFMIAFSTYHCRLTVKLDDSNIYFIRGVYDYSYFRTKIRINDIISIKKQKWRLFQGGISSVRPFEVQFNDFNWDDFSIRPNDNSDIEISYAENGEKLFHIAVKDSDKLIKFLKKRIDDPSIFEEEGEAKS